MSSSTSLYFKHDESIAILISFKTKIDPFEILLAHIFNQFIALPLQFDSPEFNLYDEFFFTSS